MIKLPRLLEQRDPARLDELISESESYFDAAAKYGTDGLDDYEENILVGFWQWLYGVDQIKEYFDHVDEEGWSDAPLYD